MLNLSVNTEKREIQGILNCLLNVKVFNFISVAGQCKTRISSLSLNQCVVLKVTSYYNMMNAGT
jgi:hypothetical protein